MNLVISYTRTVSKSIGKVIIHFVYTFSCLIFIIYIVVDSRKSFSYECIFIISRICLRVLLLKIQSHRVNKICAMRFIYYENISLIRQFTDLRKYARSRKIIISYGYMSCWYCDIWRRKKNRNSPVQYHMRLCFFSFSLTLSIHRSLYGKEKKNFFFSLCSRETASHLCDPVGKMRQRGSISVLLDVYVLVRWQIDWQLWLTFHFLNYWKIFTAAKKWFVARAVWNWPIIEYVYVIERLQNFTLVSVTMHLIDAIWKSP